MAVCTLLFAEGCIMICQFCMKSMSLGASSNDLQLGYICTSLGQLFKTLQKYASASFLRPALAKTLAKL